MRSSARFCVLGTAVWAWAAVAAPAQEPTVHAAAQERPKASGHAAAKRVIEAEIGQPAPNFKLSDDAGKSHQLSDYRGKFVVVEWISQDCPFSVTSVPLMRKTASRYAEKGVVWLAIDSTHNRRPGDNARYRKLKRLPYPILDDRAGTVGRRYGAQTTPHMFVIDKQGTLVYAGAIYNKKRERNYVDEALRDLLAGKKVALSETKPRGCLVKYKRPASQRP